MVILIGPPGAGKSLQASMLNNEGLAHWISVGQLLRGALNEAEKPQLDEGVLIDDQRVAGLIEQSLAGISARDEVVLDGFPRRLSQIDWLLDHRSPRDLKGVIVLTADHEELKKRLLKRGRPDDKSDIIEERIELYLKELGPIIEQLERLGIKVIQVDGNGTIEEVHELIKSAFLSLTKR